MVAQTTDEGSEESPLEGFFRNEKWKVADAFVVLEIIFTCDSAMRAFPFFVIISCGCGGRNYLTLILFL